MAPAVGEVNGWTLIEREDPKFGVIRMAAATIVGCSCQVKIKDKIVGSIASDDYAGYLEFMSGRRGHAFDSTKADLMYAEAKMFIEWYEKNQQSIKEKKDVK